MNNLFCVDNKWLMRYIIIIMSATPILNDTKKLNMSIKLKVFLLKELKMNVYKRKLVLNSFKPKGTHFLQAVCMIRRMGQAE